MGHNDEIGMRIAELREICGFSCEEMAEALGIEAYGVHANYRGYQGQQARDLREILARVKDFAMTVLKPEPTYLGETIPISGSGDLTHDENSDFA